MTQTTSRCEGSRHVIAWPALFRRRPPHARSLFLARLRLAVVLELLNATCADEYQFDRPSAVPWRAVSTHVFFAARAQNVVCKLQQFLGAVNRNTSICREPVGTGVLEEMS